MQFKPVASALSFYSLLLLFSPSLSADPAAEIISLSGQGETRSSESLAWSAAVISQQLNAGADVRTLSYSSAALLLADQTQLRMNANAQIRLQETSTEKTRLQLVVGRLWSRTKRASGALELETPAALAVVRGTDWDVQVDAEGRTTLSVLTGLIEVSNDYGRVEVGPSEEAYVEPGQPPVKRLLVNPQERVQWLMANPIDPERYREFSVSSSDQPLLQIRELIGDHALEQAHVLLEGLAEQEMYSVPVGLMLADFELYSGEFEQAQNRLYHLWNTYQDPRVAARRADVLIAQDRMVVARDFLDQALSVMPDSAELHLASANWWRLQGDVSQALAGYRTAIELAVSPSTQAAAYHGLGRAEMERGDLRQAREALATSVELAPENAEYIGELALESTLSYRLSEADRHYASALTLAEDDYVSLAGSGLLALQRGDTGVAQAQLLKAVTIEPRFARGQVWLAVAEFQLGNRAAALDSLNRAIQADPNDPLPWQIRSVIENDMGRPVDAINSARESLIRLPYLKSLNQLANDSQGSANLGKAFGDFGLEHWARAYAEASSHPLWAGSHFFMANRLDSDFGRRSELFKGYLADPIVFGAGSATPTLFARPGRHVELESLFWRSEARDDVSVSGTVRGLNAEPFRSAWLVQAQGLYMDPREADTLEGYELREGGLVAALGLKPTEELGVFLLHNESKSRLRFPEPIYLGGFSFFYKPEYYHLRRTDAGVSYRWNSDSQTSLKISHAGFDVDTELFDFLYGPQDRRYQATETGAHVQHTHLINEHRLNLGIESITAKGDASLGDSLFRNDQLTRQEYRMAWLAGEWRYDDWSVYTEGYWPRFKFEFLDRAVDPATGNQFAPAIELDDRSSPDFLPRVGVTRRFGAGNALHLGYLETLQAPGNHTLSPVMMGGIPIDHQFLLPGSHARKTAVRLNIELNPRMFLSLEAQQQKISNPRDATGRLFAQRLNPIPDTITRIGPREFVGGARILSYDTRPLFGRGEIQRVSMGLDTILTDNLALMTHYAHTESKNEEAAFYGNRLPGFARHDVATLATYHHGERNYTIVGARYLGGHFLDEANQSWRKASGSFSIGHSRENFHRDWRFDIGAVGLAQRDQDPEYFVKLFKRW